MHSQENKKSICLQIRVFLRVNILIDMLNPFM